MRPPPDRLKDIVEVVRYAAGELAERLHPLSMSGTHLRRFSRSDLPAHPRLLGHRHTIERGGEAAELGAIVGDAGAGGELAGPPARSKRT